MGSISMGFTKNSTFGIFNSLFLKISDRRIEVDSFFSTTIGIDKRRDGVRVEGGVCVSAYVFVRVSTYPYQGCYELWETCSSQSPGSK